MKKICFAFNHLQYSDGVARAAIGMANYLATRDDVEVTLRPIYYVDNETRKIISPKIKIKPGLRFYFRGLSKLFNLIPDKMLHNFIFGKNQYDIQIGFQHGIATKAVASYPDQDGALHLVWIHGYDERLSMKKYYLLADRLICVSKQNADRLYQDLECSHSVDYCYNPIDDRAVHNNGKEQLDIERDESPLFITVGRHSQEKGYLRLIDIVARLKNEGYIFKIWFVGDGPQHNELIEKVANKKLEDYIYFSGAQSNPHKYTSRADVFICSSFSEGYSTACTEAIMLGIPVITTNVSGAKEIIESSGAGLLVENNEEALYEGMKQILDNPVLIHKWKDIIKETKDNFSAEIRVKKLESLLNL